MLKRAIIFIIIILINFPIYSQDLIDYGSFTSFRKNQRNIVRDSEDNLYVAYHVYEAAGFNDWIKLVCYDTIQKEWSEPYIMAKGQEPNIAIDKNNNLHLVYTNSSRIIYMNKKYDEPWNEPWTTFFRIDDESYSATKEYPVGDTDSSGCFHMLYRTIDSVNTKLEYVKICKDTITCKQTIFESEVDTIVDYSIATHLCFSNNIIFITYQLSNDSIYFFNSLDNGNSWEVPEYFEVYQGLGPMLSIGIGSYGPELRMEATFPLIVSSNYDNCLYKYQSWSIYGEGSVENLITSPVDDYSLDDVIGPLGFSFIFSCNDTLFHAFDNHLDIEIRDTLIVQPTAITMAYKQFRVDVVDILWIKNNAQLFYFRTQKIPNAIEKHRNTNKLDFIAFPNPFREEITFTIFNENRSVFGEMTIYDINGKIIYSDVLNSIQEKTTYNWDFKSVKPGLYFVRLTGDKSSVIKKIIKY